MSASHHAPPRRTTVDAAFLLLAATIVLLPIVVDPWGQDAFRFPKELAFRSAAVLFGVLMVFAATARRANLREVVPVRKAALWVVGAGLAWAAIATLASTNIRLSSDSLITVLASGVLFLGFCYVLATRSLVAFDIALIAPSINAAVAILQEYAEWRPFPVPRNIANHPHLATTALLGNPNDVGAFLVLPAIAAAIASALAKGHRRSIYGVIALLLLAGLIASATRTAVIAYVAALIVATFISSRRTTALIFGLVTIVVLSIVPESTFIGRSARRLFEAAQTRRYDILFSERLPVFLTAAEMFRDRPLTGQGPGTFKWHYMHYRVELAERYPVEWTRGWPMNFGETHNDHLQTLAETGVPGYLVVLSAAGVVLLTGRWTAPRRGPSYEGDLARRLRLPIVTGALVLMLAQFPLQIAAPRTMMLFLAAICLMWSSREE